MDTLEVKSLDSAHLIHLFEMLGCELYARGYSLIGDSSGGEYGPCGVTHVGLQLPNGDSTEFKFLRMAHISQILARHYGEGSVWYGGDEYSRRELVELLLK